MSRDQLDVLRREGAVDFIERENGATIEELATQFGVSEATIRRDLATLAKQGLIQRARGGAAPRRLLTSRGVPEPPIHKRAGDESEAKARIGRAAAAHVSDGDVIIISGGTTTVEMLPHLSDRVGLTVITNALNIASVLAQQPSINVVVLGGMLRADELTMVGILVETAAADIRADRLFMGSASVDPSYGLTADHLEEVQTDRALISAAQSVHVLVDHRKFTQRGRFRSCGLDKVSHIVTDRAIGDDVAREVRSHGVGLEIV